MRQETKDTDTSDRIRLYSLLADTLKHVSRFTVFYDQDTLGTSVPGNFQ